MSPIQITDFDFDHLESIVGLVARMEFESAKDYSWTGLYRWAEGLPKLSDEDFKIVCADVIYGSAQVASWRGNWSHEHFKTTACYHESERRHQIAGHEAHCAGPTIYSRTHAQVMRDHGYQPTPSGTCSCESICA